MKRILQVALVLVLALGVFSVRGGVLAETVSVHGSDSAALAAAISSAKSGDTIKLTSDVTVATAAKIAKSVTLDLSGHTIEGNNGAANVIQIAENCKVVITNSGSSDGKILNNQESSTGVFVSGGASVTIEDGVVISGKKFGVMTNVGSVTLSGGKVTGKYAVDVTDGNVVMTGGVVSGTYSGVWITAVNKDVEGTISGGNITMGDDCYGVIVYPSTGHPAKLSITGGNIKVGKNSIALSGNGTYHGTDISITGGTLTSGDIGIYHPQRGEITIGGQAEILGGLTGVEIRSGTLNVKDNATIIGGNGPTKSDPNGSGTTTENAAIAVAQHTTNNPIAVNISGGTMQATSALYVSNPQNNTKTDANSVKVTISNGATTVPRLAGAIGVTDNRVPKFFISGGLFSKEVNKDYINKDFVGLSTGDSSYPYRVGKYVTPEDKPLPDAPAPMPNEVKDVTAKANTEAANQGMNVKADSDDIKNVGNNDLKEDEKASGAWIWLTVEPNKVENEKDRTPIQNTLKGTSQIGVWMNISLFKQVVGESQSKIPETQSPIELSIQLDSKLLMPKEKQNTHRYVVYRYHGGKVERLDTKFDAKTNTLTFSTDKFSTYALVYEEIPVEPEVTPVPVVPDMPQTGDGSQLVLFAALLGVSVMGLLLLAKRRRA